MKALKHTGLVTSTLVSAALLASPLAFAGDKDHKDGHHGKRHHAELCEKVNSGDFDEKREKYRQKHNKHHEEVADRLELTEEQRETWDEIREERHQKHQQKMEKLQERCEQKKDQ